MNDIQAHSDKYNDPRVKITSVGILCGVLVVLFGIGGAGLSIWARKTRLVQTTAFWGEDTIKAFQLAEEVELIPKPESEPEKTVRISGLPGLGHLRHVLLDERSYEWKSQLAQPIELDEDTMVLQFRDPTAKRFPNQQIVINTVSGRVGFREGEQNVQLNDRFQEAMPNFLKQIADFEPLRVENREQEK